MREQIILWQVKQKGVKKEKKLKQIRKVNHKEYNCKILIIVFEFPFVNQFGLRYV